MHHNESAIVERLEATKKFGLVSEYFLSFNGRAGRLKAKVVVWGRDGTPEDVVLDYITRLLRGLVPDQQISVAQ